MQDPCFFNLKCNVSAEDELHSSATEHLKPRPYGFTVIGTRLFFHSGMSTSKTRAAGTFDEPCCDNCMSGGATCAPPAAEPPPTYETNGNEEQSEEEEVDGKDIKAPLELVIEVKRPIIGTSCSVIQTLGDRRI